MLKRALTVLFLATVASLASPDAQAHCDSVDGPVAKAVKKALDTGNVNLVLPYAPASAEKELKVRFAVARKVRTLGPEALKLADLSFLETAIRLHRAGEGASFTGVKPAGIDYGPMIPAAEKAVESGNLQPVRAVLLKEIDHALGERLARVRQLRKAAPTEPANEGDVAAARERFSAELGFITLVEGMRRSIIEVPVHHED